MKRILVILAAFGFAAFFVALVVIANRGEGHQWWAFLDHVPYGDKLGHLGLAGTLSFLFNLALPMRHKSNWILGFITYPTIGLGVLLSLEELSQAFIPSRTCDLVDWLADLVGLGIGQMIARVAHGLGNRGR